MSKTLIVLLFKFLFRKKITNHLLRTVKALVIFKQKSNKPTTFEYNYRFLALEQPFYGCDLTNDTKNLII